MQNIQNASLALNAILAKEAFSMIYFLFVEHTISLSYDTLYPPLLFEKPL